MPTLVMIKPDGIRRGLTGLVVDRLMTAHLRITWSCFCELDVMTAEALYAEHRGKWFFDELIRHVTSQPGVALLRVAGPNAVPVARQEVLHVRQDWATSVRCNVAHASANAGAALKELTIVGGTRGANVHL